MRDPRGARKWLAVIVGVGVTALAGTSILLFREKAGPGPQNAPQGPPIDSGVREGPTGQAVAIVVDLRQYTASVGQQKGQRQPISLPRRRLHVSLLLPAGLPAGPYDIQVHDAEQRRTESVSGLAALRDGVVTVRITLDLASLPSGPYTLAVRERNEEWRRFPANVR